MGNVKTYLDIRRSNCVMFMQAEGLVLDDSFQPGMTSPIRSSYWTDKNRTKTGMIQPTRDGWFAVVWQAPQVIQQQAA